MKGLFFTNLDYLFIKRLILQTATRRTYIYTETSKHMRDVGNRRTAVSIGNVWYLYPDREWERATVT